MTGAPEEPAELGAVVGSLPWPVTLAAPGGSSAVDADGRMEEMEDTEWLADRFEQHRSRLRAVAYRMLGSFAEADDAVQDAWIRVDRAGADDVDNIGAWLTTVVARICLNMLRSRGIRREEGLPVHLPDPIISADGQLQPEEEAVLADSLGLALQVVLDTLTPAERLAFVLHDMFELPFEEIGPMVDRTPEAARQLASRARRRVRGVEGPSSEADRSRQRTLVEAFFAAARSGDLEALVAVLHPDVVLRADFGPRRPARSTLVRGAEAVAQQAKLGASLAAELHPVLVNGAPGVVITMRGRPYAVMAFCVVGDRITEIDVIAEPDRVTRLAAATVDDDLRRAP